MKSVGSRLMTIILTIAIVGMGLIVGIGNVIASAALHEQSLGRIAEISGREANIVDSWISSHISYLEAVAGDLSCMPGVGREDVLPYLARHTGANDDYQTVYVGYPSGQAVFGDGWEPDYRQWKATEREWFKGAMANPGKVYLTGMYVDAATGDICLTISITFTHNGSVAGVLAIDILTGIINDVVSGISVGDQSYAFLTDANGYIIEHPDPEYAPFTYGDDTVVFNHIEAISGGSIAPLSPDATGQFFRFQGSDGIARYYTASVVKTTGWLLYTAVPVRVVDAPIYRQLTVAGILFAAVLIAVAVSLHYSLRKLIVRPVKAVTNAANSLSRGESGVLPNDRYVGEIALLADSFRRMDEFNRQQTEWAKRISDGDLSIVITPRGEGDHIAHAIGSMLEKLNDMFLNINHSAHQVSTASKQIALGAQSLAQGSAEQNSAIEALSASMTDIAEKTKRNAETADAAAILTEEMRVNAEKGNSHMERMMESVKEINKANNAIRNVINTIDDIASQTNLLALNAAVEAARAGVHGRGFVVVADEVRNLAAKSSEAARNTGLLIENSIVKANLGLSIATETSGSLNEIVEAVSRGNEMAIMIAKASGEQSESIEQINKGIEQVAEVIQQNSLTAEQSAAASKDMSDQSGLLVAQISRFKLRDEK